MSMLSSMFNLCQCYAHPVVSPSRSRFLPSPPHSILPISTYPVLNLRASASLQAICREYHKRITSLEDAKYDLEYAVRQKEFVINELNVQVNDMRGKFIKPVLKKVSKFEYGKFEKLMRAAKKADNDFRANLKSVGPSTKFKLDEDVKEAKPDWALGSKKEEKAEE